jgi:hypothetical protein
MGFAGYVSVCVQLYCVGFPLSFTTCFGLHGHLQVCDSSIFIFIYLRILLRWFLVCCPFFYVVTLCVFSICVLSCAQHRKQIEAAKQNPSCI